MSRPTSRPPSAQQSHHSPSPSPGPAAGPSLTPTQLRLLEKQQEHEGLLALKKASGDMLERIEELARMGNVMADGGEAVGSVLRNWPHVFSILNLFDHTTPTPAPTSTSTSLPPSTDPAAQEEAKQLPQLVRLAYGGGPGEEGERGV